MSKILHIVVPCDSTAPIEPFARHLAAFFRRFGVPSDMKYFTSFMLRDGESPTGSGALKNAGFLLGLQHSDYTCFNDPLCWPVWADYSWADTPASLAWSEFLCASHDGDSISPRLEACRRNMSVLLTPNAKHLLVDGYSNVSIGEEASAEDLRKRYQACGIAVEQRASTFLLRASAPLSATPERETAGGPETPSDVNQRREGLSTLVFQVIGQRMLALPEADDLPHQIVMVRIGLEPAVPAKISPPSDVGNSLSDQVSRRLRQWLVAALERKVR